MNEEGRATAEAHLLLAALARSGRTVAVAESCTGGLLGYLLTAIPGASESFLGGVIAYSNQVKTAALGVSKAVIEERGAVSGEVAAAMGQGVRAAVGSDWGVAVTGIAGPGGGTPEKPVGTVWIGVAGPQKAQEERFAFSGGRRAIRWEAASAAFAAVRALCEQGD